jgi:hypothetical protein
VQEARPAYSKASSEVEVGAVSRDVQGSGKAYIRHAHTRAQGVESLWESDACAWRRRDMSPVYSYSYIDTHTYTHTHTHAHMSIVDCVQRS